mmetsp:Transcript_80087/g.194156  ORF Transcript_80087/g.194156 Transcript_80087/m.194156 type:complete len:223 (+) Transcript_80087:264-932(+)
MHLALTVRRGCAVHVQPAAPTGAPSGHWPSVGKENQLPTLALPLHWPCWGPSPRPRALCRPTLFPDPLKHMFFPSWYLQYAYWPQEELACTDQLVTTCDSSNPARLQKKAKSPKASPAFRFSKLLGSLRLRTRYIINDSRPAFGHGAVGQLSLQTSLGRKASAGWGPTEMLDNVQTVSGTYGVLELNWRGTPSHPRHAEAWNPVHEAAHNSQGSPATVLLPW